jgi:hypothetical protein
MESVESYVSLLANARATGALRIFFNSQGVDLGIERQGQDPRAVSDPRLSLDEFPELVGDPQIVLGPDLIATADQVVAARRCEQCTEGSARGLEADDLEFQAFLDATGPPD